MATVQTSNSLTSMVIKYYDRRMLERLTPQLMFLQFGVPKELPKNEGKTIIWHRWNLFTKGKLITESGPGISRGISATSLSAQLLMVGDVATISTFIDMVAINSVVQGAIDLFADAAALTIDWCIGRMLLWYKASNSARFEAASTSGYVGGVNILSAIGTVSAAQFQAPLWSIDDLTTRNKAASALDGGDSGTLFTPAIIRALVLKLKVKNALPFEDGYFKAIVHPDLVNQLRSSSAFIDLNKYVDNMLFAQGTMPTGRVTERGLVGVMEKVKFYESTEAPMCSVTAAKMSAHGYGRYYFSFFFGKNSYGVTDFDGGLHTYIKTPGPNTVSVPLNQYGTVGYKAVFTSKILNPSACLWLLSGKPTVVG